MSKYLTNASVSFAMQTLPLLYHRRTIINTFIVFFEEKKSNFRHCLIQWRNIGHVTSTFNDMLMWFIPYLHICTVAPITFPTQAEKLYVLWPPWFSQLEVMSIEPTMEDVSLHRSISLGGSRASFSWRLGFPWFKTEFKMLKAWNFWNFPLLLIWRCHSNGLRLLAYWISPISVIGGFSYDVSSVQSSSRGLLSFQTVLSSSSPTYTVLPSGVTVMSWGSWNPWSHGDHQDMMSYGYLTSSPRSMVNPCGTVCLPESRGSGPLTPYRNCPSPLLAAFGLYSMAKTLPR